MKLLSNFTEIIVCYKFCKNFNLLCKLSFVCERDIVMTTLIGKNSSIAHTENDEYALASIFHSSRIKITRWFVRIVIQSYSTTVLIVQHHCIWLQEVSFVLLYMCMYYMGTFPVLLFNECYFATFSKWRVSLVLFIIAGFLYKRNNEQNVWFMVQVSEQGSHDSRGVTTYSKLIKVTLLKLDNTEMCKWIYVSLSDCHLIFSIYELSILLTCFAYSIIYFHQIFHFHLYN